MDVLLKNKKAMFYTKLLANYYICLICNYNKPSHTYSVEEHAHRQEITLNAPSLQYRDEEQHNINRKYMHTHAHTHIYIYIYFSLDHMAPTE